MSVKQFNYDEFKQLLINNNYIDDGKTTIENYENIEKYVELCDRSKWGESYDLSQLFGLHKVDLKYEIGKSVIRMSVDRFMGRYKTKNGIEFL